MTGGPYAFPSAAIGQRFREEAYALVNVPLPQQAPARITYLMSVGGEVVRVHCLLARAAYHINSSLHNQVYNNDKVLQALVDVAELLGLHARPASLTPGAPFRSFVSLMSRTGVLISRHGPQLTNVLFLPPGM